MNEKPKNPEITLPVSLRDYFAAKAMQGMIAAATANPNASEYPRPTEVARRAFRFADAMLEERAKL